MSATGLWDPFDLRAIRWSLCPQGLAADRGAMSRFENREGRFKRRFRFREVANGETTLEPSGGGVVFLDVLKMLVGQDDVIQVL